jgi:hypothetical protein
MDSAGHCGRNSLYSELHQYRSLSSRRQGGRCRSTGGSRHDVRRPCRSSPEAQAYFDQGMRFLWAFNHDEATRSFAKAAMLDSHCASCYWGVALTIGPNYNLPMMAEPRGRVAWDALQQAKNHSTSATPVELALISALAKRYPSAAALEPVNLASPLTAYADAMKEVTAQFPNDAYVAT